MSVHGMENRTDFLVGIKKKLHGASLTTISFLLAPILAIILTLSLVYRRAVSLVLKTQLGEKFVCLLDGTDSVWTVEDPSSLSVINILAILEKDALHSNLNFLESFRSLVKSRLVDSPFEKLLYTRGKKFGYSFWQRNAEIDLEERVRWLEYERNSCDGSCDNIYSGHLKRILWNVCNKPLPDNHTASWEILIGKCCPRSSHHYLRRMEERLENGRIRIPILFRVHHSLGDGSALLRLFQEAVVDREPRQEELLKIEILSLNLPSLNYPETRLLVEKSLPYSSREDVLSASMPFVHPKVLSNSVDLIRGYFTLVAKRFQRLNLDEIRSDAKIILRAKWRRFKKTLGRFFKLIRRYFRAAMIVFAAPSCLVRQSLRSADNSVLRGPKLTGEKLVSYWLEDDFRNPYDQKLIEKIRCIKCVTSSRFRDVLLAALSVSLHKYFLRVEEDAPDKLSVVLPTEIDDAPTENLSLKNDFSVEVLSLCVSRINGEKSVDPTEDPRTLDRIEDVKKASRELGDSLDRVVNFFAIKCLSAVLPEIFLRPVLESRCTMIFTNIAGPREVRILGHPLKNIAFWIPNRSHTGIGCSLLTYRGYVQLSLMADKALIRDEKLLGEILENTVHEIDDLYDRLMASTFSKRFTETRRQYPRK